MIKLLLVAALLVFTVLELRGTRSAGHTALRRLIAGCLLLLGLVGVIFPDAVTRLANAIGVGRGADLVLYALVVVFLFSTLGLYQRLRRLEERYTELARKVAIEEATQTAPITIGSPAGQGTESTDVDGRARSRRMAS